MKIKHKKLFYFHLFILKIHSYQRANVNLVAGAHESNFKSLLFLTFLKFRFVFNNFSLWKNLNLIFILSGSIRVVVSSNVVVLIPLWKNEYSWIVLEKAHVKIYRYSKLKFLKITTAVSTIFWRNVNMFENSDTVKNWQTN